MTSSTYKLSFTYFTFVKDFRLSCATPLRLSKKPLQLPQGSIKSVDPSKKPRIVYFQYKPSRNGLRTLRQHFVTLQEGDDFQCGDDTSHLFKDDSNLKSKNITTDRRLTCGSPIEFAHYTVQHSVKGKILW